MVSTGQAAAKQLGKGLSCCICLESFGQQLQHIEDLFARSLFLAISNQTGYCNTGKWNKYDSDHAKCEMDLNGTIFNSPHLI